MSGKTIRYAGLLTVGIISLAVLYAFYGNLFDKLNQVSFASGGDGLQSYVNMEFHIKYDTSYMRSNSMNYPYGEHVFFTNNQPLFSNTVKFISNHIIDISDYTLGMLNFLMLFSLVITPLILYLIFAHVGVGPIISIVASIGITYLSPQLDRFGGHFNLSYVCAIPLMILLVLKFFTKPSWLISVFIFFTMLAGALTHFYLYGFFAIILLFFYGTVLLKDKSVFSDKIHMVIHFFIQLILPFLILQAFYISDSITDRPSFPWGFLYYRAYPQSIFLPFGRPYGQFLYSLVRINFIDWEGYAYVGLTAFGGTIFFLIVVLKKIIQKKFNQITKISSDQQVNILFWASIAGLLYSFGLPFILGLEWLVDLIGPIRQMRGIARFAWLFYYIINIVTVYWLWTWFKKDKHLLKVLVISAALIMLCIDAYYNVRNRGSRLENHIPELTDSDLILPENQWIRRVNVDQYQAMIPLPYFHVGSENFWIDGACDIANKSFIAIKTSGLPNMGALLSRTSINQTVENVSSIIGPSCDALNVGRFPNKKPFLLMVARCELKYWHEKELVRHARRIDSSGVFDIYALPFEAFENIRDSLSQKTFRDYNDQLLYHQKKLASTDSSFSFRLINYDSLHNDSLLYGTGCFAVKAGNKTILYHGLVPGKDTSRLYNFSFWILNIRDDLYPRTNIYITESDSLGTVVNSLSYPISKQLSMVSGNRALVEYAFRIAKRSNLITIQIQNRMLKNKLLRIDNTLIRPVTTDIFYPDGDKLWKNNYFYCR